MKPTRDGFITGNDTDFMARLAKRLNEIAPKLNARVEHTGGGIFCVYAEGPMPDQFMYWGTETNTWAADINDENGDYIGSIVTKAPCNQCELEEVTAAILEAVGSSDG